MIETYRLLYHSPIGVIEITGTDEAILSILFIEQENPTLYNKDRLPGVLEDCKKQLDEYFKGKRSDFTFPYQLKGTDFQKKVWSALTEITYAETVSYKDIAEAIGNEKAIRAVGNANGKNKLSIVIPCHRIIGSDGKLTGYAGGLWRKEWLLGHESSLRKE
ncbi:methylated-DNA-[protein]-cysteine S-methyltransferase [Bacillus mesophilus]|uniref:Methylated-DNA--protein-cysteine methyltransferase n=1 Tax=Bacillus mesophilus TaxID=1808955 RepID=A0A6M0Q9M6_9BACI|nr:methylated-DNA--[protein]-cysteine S-methyltransferase [Bacillus mesophilus]MBM7662295.1 methylated-DNA-[protein]-cysteine S-methyltransferase [Bacillus mesophilus]NEY73071.1 methylated-DNA--[protein]-cysteine S-methyltransferase [Bacillus mesophilus]